MKITLLTFLLCILCVQAHAGTRKAKHGNGNQQPSADAATIAAPEQSPLTQTPQLANQPQIGNKTAAISTPTEDRWDKAGVIINGTLAIIGFGGVIAAFCNLRVINRQAREATLQRIATHNTLIAIKKQVEVMEQQATDARNAAAAADVVTKATLETIKRQADLTDQQVQIAINRERARVYVKMAPKDWSF